MKVLVVVTQTQDTEAKIKVASEGDRIDTSGIKWILNPYDEFAVEEAIRIKEKLGGEVVLITAGPDRAIEALRQGLAMGADRSVFIKDPGFELADAYVFGKVVGHVIKNLDEKFDIILTGLKTIDEETGQIGIQIAEELGIPHVSVVNKIIEIDPDGKKVVCQKEIDSGQAIVEVQLPALLTCPDGMNEPRYASLPGIMKAKKKPLKEITLNDIDLGALGLTKESIGKQGARVKTVQIQIPEIERKLHIIKGEDEPMVKGEAVAKAARELAKLLREEAKVI